MARKKKGDGALAGVVLLGVFFALVASIPKPVWIFMGVCAVVGVVWLLFSNGKKHPAPAAQREKPRRSSTPTPTPTPTPVSSSRNKLAEPQSHATTVESEPVSLYQRPNSTEEHRIPVAPQGFGPAAWVPPGESTNIAGIVVPGGMLYVGTSLPTPSGLPDPALIDPSKKVASRGC